MDSGFRSQPQFGQGFSAAGLGSFFIDDNRQKPHKPDRQRRPREETQTATPDRTRIAPNRSGDAEEPKREPS
jgi:hypothetical protein